MHDTLGMSHIGDALNAVHTQQYVNPTYTLFVVAYSLNCIQSNTVRVIRARTTPEMYAKARRKIIFS